MKRDSSRPGTGRRAQACICAQAQAGGRAGTGRRRQAETGEQPWAGTGKAQVQVDVRGQAETDGQAWADGHRQAGWRKQIQMQAGVHGRCS